MRARYGTRPMRARTDREDGAPDRGRTTSFVMTLWLEPQQASGEPEWRWRVTQVRTGEQRYFHRLADVLAYVSINAGVPAPR